jgi:hypothetical protein
MEKHEHPTLADAILHPKTEKPDVKSLTADIQKLKANPQTNDPMWWNNLAGSYLRLGQADQAVKILEPVTNRFPNDYGIHANLGTAYHLLRRYVEAEREIRRDTEINTNAHFGLEKYHLALLQYLIRSKDYQLRHVYVDELTTDFLFWGGGQHEPDLQQSPYFRPFSAEERKKAEVEAKQYFSLGGDPWINHGFEPLWKLALGDEQPQYRAKWNLAEDPKLQEGVIYMASLNPKEPACWVILGVVAAQGSDMKLAKTAWKKAIELGSGQSRLLQTHMTSTWEIKSNDWREESLPEFLERNWIYALCSATVLLLIGLRIKRIFRRERTEPLKTVKRH